MGTTTNYSWPIPEDTDLVKDGAEAIRDLGNAIDTSAADFGGGLVHIKTQAVSGAVSHSFGSDADPIFTSEFDNYKILIYNASSATSDQAISFRLRANTTDYTSAGYDSQTLTANGTTLTGVRVASGTSLNIGTVGHLEISSFVIDITRPNINANKTLHISNSYSLSGTGLVNRNIAGLIVSAGVRNGFTIFAGTNLTATVSVYGYKK
jgi:hypothetical protein